MDDIPLDNRAPRPAADTPFRMMVETAGDILFIAAPDGSVTYFNPRWYKFTGLTPEQSLGWRWMQRIHPDDRDKAMDGWRRALESGSPWVTRLPLIGRDGTDCCFLCRARPLGASGENWFGACADIDELVRAEEALRASKQALTEAARRKDEFLAILAHELRNPLAPLSTGLEIMRRAGGDLVVIDKARTMMQGQVAQMVRLVDDLLDVSRITRGKLELRKARVELATIVANAVDTARPEIDAGHHRLHVDLPPQPVWLDADANRLAQVFANLLNNAARYTREPGDIRLTATVEAGEVAVTVSDTGIGIQRDKLNVIFDRFTQVEQQFEQTP
ncbi:MAG TPA: PAS domain-containing sensor histidine kinase, partial [Gammaproteobacteria bacterium]|nr:PAS domain-containing sensor histidine kinase [Gammaproteobacteria bacterium]